jgi:serine/threonine protein kinase
MEVCEQNEAWVERDGDWVFSHTKIILKKDDQYFVATSMHRYRSAADVNLADLDLISIPASKIWPQYPEHFKRAPTPIPENCYVKRPSLLYYGDTEASTRLSEHILHEAQICEILQASPHPNIARYLGCLVDNGRITGLCFVKYDMTLSQRVSQASQPFDAKHLLQCIREGVRHLHSLGIIHCDLNPTNILMWGESAVIADFDSCQMKGKKLGLKAGTRGWTSDNFKYALAENDQYGLSLIEEYLLEVQNNMNL